MNEWHAAKTSVSTSPLSAVFIKKWKGKKSQKYPINVLYFIFFKKEKERKIWRNDVNLSTGGTSRAATKVTLPSRQQTSSLQGVKKIRTLTSDL